jgi:hypothetical protein
MYFESGEAIHSTFADAIVSYGEGFGREAKAAAHAIMNIRWDGLDFTDGADKEFCRQKLQDFIFTIAWQFRDTFIDNGQDATKCTRVPHPLRLPNDPRDRDSVLREAILTLSAEDECRKKCQIHSLFERNRYREKFDAIAELRSTNDSLTKIQEAINKARENPGDITCKLCAKMGDAIVASSLDPTWKLHSLDHVHGPISDAIKLQHVIHPSNTALKKVTGKTGTKTGDE